MIKALKERAEAMLSNLVSASKTYMTSLGMSPVSLLDVAANHILATVTEIGRMVCISKASQTEQDDFNGSFALSLALLNLATVNGLSPSLHSVEEVKPLHQTKASSGAGLS